MSERLQLPLMGFSVLIAVAIIATAAMFAPRPFEAFAFYIFASVIVVSCLGCVLSQNIVRTAAWLLGALAATAGLFLLLSANFLAVVQLIAYAGGILVLIVFGIMLTVKNPASRERPAAREVLLAVLTLGTLLAGLLALVIPAFSRSGLPAPNPTANATPADVASLGEALLSGYWLPLQMLAFLLLAVMIGAAYLARPEKK